MAENNLVEASLIRVQLRFYTFATISTAVTVIILMRMATVWGLGLMFERSLLVLHLLRSPLGTQRR
jgi:hypothetical protein